MFLSTLQRVYFWVGTFAVGISAVQASAVPNLKKVVWIIFENTTYSKTMTQPYFSELAKNGALLTNFFAETHPSQPNYIALTSGSTQGVFDDNNVNLNVKHIGDLLEAKGKTWRAYAEAYPGDCYKGGSKGSYARKHLPFISYTNVQNSPKRCANLREGDTFFDDVNNGTLADFSFYAPDIDDDGHDTGVAYADGWLEKTFRPLIGSEKFQDVTLFITFDEDDTAHDNQIYTAVVGNMVRSGATSSQKYNHYSILRTLEDAWQLGTLGKNDAKASSIENIWDVPMKKKHQ